MLLVVAACLALRQSARAPIVTVDDVLRQYKSFGLPFPPSDASLVTIRNDFGVEFVYLLSDRPVHCSRDFPSEYPCFIGTQRVVCYCDPEPIGDPILDATMVSPGPISELPIEEDTDLATVAIEAERGHTLVADTLLNHISDRSHTGIPREAALSTSQEGSLRTRLAFLALAHWKNELGHRKSNRTLIATRLRKLFETDPVVKLQSSTELLADLVETIEHPRTGPHGERDLADEFCNQDLSIDADRIYDKGISVLPTLARHLGDRRLTRSIYSRVMNIAEGIGRVGDACRSLLWAFGYQGDSDNASELEKWIAEVKRIGEHQYAVQPVEDRVDDGTHEGIEAIEHRPTALLRLLQVKYPQDLPAVWAHVIAEHPEFDDYPVLQAIWYSSLPRERKVEAFELGLTSKNYGCIELSLYLLSQFDQSRYEREAPRMIRRLPDAVPDAFDVHDAVQVAANGLSARNPEAFAALVDLTTRAAKQFKIELLECASRADNTAQGRKCLAFLRHFMDDPTLLSAPKLLPEERSLPSATKDYAAEYAAQLLQIELPNNKSQGYWDMVRAMVLKRMEKPYVYRPCP